MIKANDNMHGFIVESITSVPDVKGRVWRMRHLQSGADLLWLDREDDVKSFVIGFKTLPEDDSGVAHILEHSVFCGSKKYPVGSPFDELRKSSPNVFMNAVTERDRTYYLFATRNDVDYLNVADVYLDAVFNPLSMSEPSAFEQERRVVFNEVKGVSADPKMIACRGILHELYPDIVYGNDSGGRPEAIARLTYEQYRDFYRKFYHPSNAKIFLDGSVDLSAILAKLDSYLQNASVSSVEIPEIHTQLPCANSRTITYPSYEIKDKTILCLGWSTALVDNMIDYAAVSFLAAYFCKMKESPLKRTLLDRKLCGSVSFGMFNFRQRPLILVLGDTSERRIEDCRTAVREVLEQVLAKGIDMRRMNALIDDCEFWARNLNTAGPRGFSYYLWGCRNWWYGGDPSEGFMLTKKYAALRDGLSNGLFEQCIRRYLLDNPHHSELTLSPCPSSSFQDPHVELSPSLASRRKSPDSANCIPRLNIADLDRHCKRIDSEISTSDGVTFIKTRAKSNDVAYLSLCFPIDNLSITQLSCVRLFAMTFGNLNTYKYTANALQTELSLRIGQLLIYPIALPRGNLIQIDIDFQVSKFEKVVEILREALIGTRFDSLQSINRLFSTLLKFVKHDAITNGNDLARFTAGAVLNRFRASLDALYGLTLLRWLQSVKPDETHLLQFREFHKTIFRRNDLVLSHTDNLSENQVLAVAGIFPSVDNPMTAVSEIGRQFAAPLGLKIIGDTGFSGWMAAVPNCYTGQMLVALQILSHGYLQQVVRERGGAYGADVTVDCDDVIAACSYCDPTPVESLAAIGNMDKALRAFIKSGESIDRYIVPLLADPYRPPSGEARLALNCFLSRQTQEDIDRMRQEVLSTRKTDLLSIADSLEEASKTAVKCVVGGENQLKGIPSDSIEYVSQNHE